MDNTEYIYPAIGAVAGYLIGESGMYAAAGAAAGYAAWAVSNRGTASHPIVSKHPITSKPISLIPPGYGGKPISIPPASYGPPLSPGPVISKSPLGAGPVIVPPAKGNLSWYKKWSQQQEKYWVNQVGNIIKKAQHGVPPPTKSIIKSY